MLAYSTAQCCPLFESLLRRWYLAFPTGKCDAQSKGHHVTIHSAAQSPSYNASQVRWEWEPAWGPLEYDNDRSGYVNLSSGVDLWYATMGQPCDEHLPVLVLHGGTATSHSMYRQASFLAKTREVIVTE